MPITEPPGQADAIVVGAGPNGLTAAITLARAGLAVRVFEAAEKVGGGARTENLTIPGFRHDPCSAVHPFAVGSPVLRAMPLRRFGLEWVEPRFALAHPFPDSSAVVLARSLAETVRSLDIDEDAYRHLIGPFLGRWDDLTAEVLRSPLAAWPRHPVLLGRFGCRAVAPAALLARRFRGEHARALLAGLAAHAMAPLRTPGTGGVASLLALAAHEVGWPFPRGGSQALSDALAGYLRSLGGEINTGRPVRSLAELPTARVYLLDVSPKALLTIAGGRLPRCYSRRVRRYRYGPAVFKVDYALGGPVPWAAPACHHAGTVHLGATYSEISDALTAVGRGTAPRPPFLIAAQPSVFDPSRAPEGKHVLWAYAHVPHAWRGDLAAAIDQQIERFAPGFSDLVLARHSASPAEVEAGNPNNIGGDIGGGAFRGLQAVFRPIVTRHPYSTGNPTIYLCSASTPPGPGVHGMSGYHAARTALRNVFGVNAALSGPAEP